MALLPPVKNYCSQQMERLRLRLAHANALPQLALLGVISGLVAGAVIIAFRLLIEGVQGAFVGGEGEYYEALPLWLQFSLPLGGAMLIGLIYLFFKTETVQVGVVHVMERLAYHQGHLPWKNALVQFFGGAASLISGHSVGREGPGIHLGAASSSLLGQYFALPNNSIRILVGCGVAAAIAASFNTPLAGVIFAMEVVMMEYTLISFTPVILAAVSATSLTQWVFGNRPVFDIPSLTLSSLAELPMVIVLGLIIGLMAALFTQMMQTFTKLLRDHNPFVRLTLAGLIIGLCAVIAPQIMGVGYDTVNAALIGEISIQVLLLVAAAKIIATTAGLGLGLPGGLIGPTLVIGATVGGLVGSLAELWLGEGPTYTAYYALLGMAAMMGATLQAPLAALTAMLELTYNPGMILPAMLAIVSASLTSSEVFGKRSVFWHLMRDRGLDYQNDPISQSLRRSGVASAMNRSLVDVSAQLEPERLEAVLNEHPQWMLVREGQDVKYILPAADVARALTLQKESDNPQGSLDLGKIPAQRMQVASVHLQASLQEAQSLLKQDNIDALIVQRPIAPGVLRTYGILTQADVDKGYRLSG